MTLKVSVIAEGNASGAVKAMNETAGAIDKVSAENRTAAAAADRAAVAARGHQVALQAQAAAARMAAMQSRNLAFQLNDVFVSLASGMNPIMVMVQQGSQIAQIYGSGEGGIGRAFREAGAMLGGLVTKFAPVIAIGGTFAAVVAGITHEINRASSAQVSWGDVAQGIFQTIGDRLYGLVKPAFEGIRKWATENWDSVVTGAKWAGNAMVGAFVLATANIKSAFASLPAVLGDLMVTATQNVVNTIASMVREVIATLNGFLAQANGLLGTSLSLGDPNKLAPDVKFDNPWAGAVGDLTAQFRKNAADAYGTDYMGDFLADIASRAHKNAAARQGDGKAGKVSDYAREIGQMRERAAALELERKSIGLSTYESERLRKVFELENAARQDAIGLTVARVAEIGREAAAYAAQTAELERAKMVYDGLKEAWSGFFSDFRSNVREGQTALQSFADAGVNALNRLGDRLADFAADQAFNAIFRLIGGTAMGGGLTIAGGGAIPSGGFIPGITGPRLFARGGISDRPAIFGEAGPEAAVPLPDGRRIPVDLRGGTPGSLTINSTINVAGSIPDADAFHDILDQRDRALIARIDQQLPDAVRYINYNPRRSGGGILR